MEHTSCMNKSARMTGSLKTEVKMDGILLLFFNLYISIVNRKKSWPVLVIIIVITPRHYLAPPPRR